MAKSVALHAADITRGFKRMRYLTKNAFGDTDVP